MYHYLIKQKKEDLRALPLDVKAELDYFLKPNRFIANVPIIRGASIICSPSL